MQARTHHRNTFQCSYEVHLVTPPPDNDPKRYPGKAHNASEGAPGRPGYQKYRFRTPHQAIASCQNRGGGFAPKRPPPDNKTTPKRYPGNAHGTSGSAPGRPGYQKYCFGSPPEPWSGDRGDRPRPTSARQRNGTQTIPWKRACPEQEHSRAPGVSKVSFPDNPHQAAPSCLHRIACRGSPANDPRPTTKRPPNDTLETRVARAGALQGAQGIKSIVFGPP